MTPAQVLAGDFQYVDGTEQVTYYSKLADGSFAVGVVVSNALRRQPSHEEVLSREALGKKTAHWNIWATQLPAVTPKVHDQLTDSSNATWIVTDVEFDTLLTRYLFRAVLAK